jgi:hypothetical protein
MFTRAVSVSAIDNVPHPELAVRALINFTKGEYSKLLRTSVAETEQELFIYVSAQPEL